MKKFLSFVISNPMILALLFISVVFLPNAISAPPEGVQRQYVATLGLDLAPEGIELSILTHVSRNSATYNETYIINSATAESIPRARLLFIRFPASRGTAVRLLRILRALACLSLR